MRQWQDAEGSHIDVRGLSPPQPMVAILRLLQSTGEGVAVIAHLDRDPQMLYPELAQIGWQAEAVAGDPADPGETRLRLTRIPA